MDKLEGTIEVSRTYDAPIELIWQAWTDPEHFKRWYGPKGFTIPVAELDVRVGGKRLVCMEMQTPDRTMKMWTTGEHTEVTPVHRLVYTESPSDEKGNVVSPADMGMPEGYPVKTVVTISLEDLGGRTKMVLLHAGMPAGSGANAGWEQAFDKLGEHLSNAGSA